MEATKSMSVLIDISTKFFCVDASVIVLEGFREKKAGPVFVHSGLVA